MVQLHQTLFTVWGLGWMSILRHTNAQQNGGNSSVLAPHERATFIGYHYSVDDGFTITQPIGCTEDTRTWSTSGRFGDCCPDPDPDTIPCRIATACGGATIEMSGVGFDCSPRSCESMTVYETLPFGGPAQTYFFCATNWKAHTVYREPQAMTTDTSASETSTSAEPTNVSSGSETNIATARETSSDSPEPTPPQTRSNLGLIVGVTVAGVVCVAGLAFVIVCVRKRRRRAKTSVMPPTGDPIKEHPDKRVMLGPILPVSEMADTPVSTTPYELEAYDEPQPQARI